MKYRNTGDIFPSPHSSQMLSVESLRERSGLILGTDIYEPMTGREAVYSPYEVPALYIPSVAAGESPGPLMQHQEDVMIMHDALITSELASRVSPSVLAFVRNSIHSRMVEQVGLNGHCYSARLHKSPSAVTESCRAALEGTANVRQAAEAREQLGMVSAPLAEITVIGDKRTEYLPDMFNEVSQFIGHDVSHIEPYRLDVIGFDREPDCRKTQHLGAMRVKMKRHLGTLSDGTVVKQRTLAIIDLSRKAGVDTEITQAIFDAYSRSKRAAETRALGRITLDTDQDSILRYLRENLKLSDKEAELNYAILPQVSMMLDGLIERGMTSHVVLARNETIYAYNESTDKIIHAKN